MRRPDPILSVGLVMLAAGGVLYLNLLSLAAVPFWARWLVGSFLWYIGFAITAVRGLCVFFGGERQEPAARPAEKTSAAELATVAAAKPVLHLAAAVMMVATSASGYVAPPADVPTPEDTQLYKSKCAMCHGPDGTGNTMMGKKLGLKDLADAQVQAQSDAQLLEVITKGRNKMPASGGKLSPAEIGRMVSMVRSLARK